MATATMAEHVDRMLKVAEAAAMTGVSGGMIFKLIYNGTLRHTKIGKAVRIRESDVRRLIDENTFGGQGDCTISHFPSSTFSRYVSSQPAVRRLFLMPTLAVVSRFNRLNAVRRRLLKLASAWRFRMRH